MKHPYRWVRPDRLPTLRNIVIVFFGLVLATQLILGVPANGPQGLLMGRVHQPNIADQMRAAWGETGALRASVILGYDFVFMVSVGLLLSVGCVMVSQRRQHAWIEPIGSSLAWIALVGSAFDWAESSSTVRLLAQADPVWLPGVVRWCSSLKFLCWSSSLAFILIFGLLRSRPRQPSQA